MALVVGHSQTKYLSELLCGQDYSVFAYPGGRNLQFLDKSEVFDVAPFFSAIVLMTGANDVGYKSPCMIVEDILTICEAIHGRAPSAQILVSEVLHRGQNYFHGCRWLQDEIDSWNDDVDDINKLLKRSVVDTSWLQVLEQSDFCGAPSRLMARDGLHLNHCGNDTLARNIDKAVRNLKVQQQRCTPRVVATSHPGVIGPLRYSDIVIVNLPKPVAKPNQSVTKPNQSATKPNQSVAKPNQSVTKPNQSVAKPNQSVTKPNQSVAKPNKSVTKPNKSVTKPNQSVAKPNQSVAKPNQSVTKQSKSKTQQPTELDITVAWIENPKEIPALRPGELTGGGFTTPVMICS